MPIPQNGQKHSSNWSAVADELFECIWPVCGVGGYRVNYVSDTIMKAIFKQLLERDQQWSGLAKSVTSS